MGNDVGQVKYHDWSYCEEPSYGVPPASPTFKELVHNSSGLKPSRAKLQSRRQTGNRTTKPHRLGKKRCDGPLGIELAYGTHDDFLEALFGGRFPTPFTQVAASTLACVASTQSITDSGSGLGDISAGDWIIVDGFTETANNGVFKVATASAGEITVQYGSTSLVDEAAGDSVTIDQQVRLEALSDFDTPFQQISADTISVTAASNTIADSGSGLGNIAVGDYIVTAGFSNAGNNGIWKVATASAASITVTGDGTMVDESAGNTITIDQKIKRSFAMLGRHKDLGLYHLFKGIMVNAGDFTIVPDDITKVTFGLIGADFDKDYSAVSSITAAAANEPFDSLSAAVTEDGTSVCMTNLAMNVTNNNALSDKCVGTTVATNQSQGDLVISGTIRFYLKDNTHIDAWWTETSIALNFTLADPDGNQYTFGLPYCLLSEFDMGKGEGNIEYEDAYNLDAYVDPTTGVMAYVIKTAA